ncbi:hypothetical protein BGZ46_004169, partial [Entomortierella lignicola]
TPNTTESDDIDDDEVVPLPLNIKRIEFKLSLLEDQEMIPLLKRCPKLETLVCGSQTEAISQELSLAIREHCPQLNELLLERSSLHFTDEIIAQLFNASTRGWKSIQIPFLISLGPLSAEALLKHAPSIEVLRAYGCSGLTSSVIQTLLSSAPNLKRLELLDRRAGGRIAIELDAQDIIQSPWICKELEVLRIKITGIRRPDLHIRTNKRPLTGPLHEGTMSYSIQDKVYSQLGKMTRLKELILGADDPTISGFNEQQEIENEGEFYDRSHPQLWCQYECLSFTLESDMGRLQGLKSLERLHLSGMAVGFGDATEQEWVKDNWPSLKYSYGGWNSDDILNNGQRYDQFFKLLRKNIYLIWNI